jgi:hypothetical protein
VYLQAFDFVGSFVLTLCRLEDILPTGDAEQDAQDKKRYCTKMSPKTPERLFWSCRLALNLRFHAINISIRRANASSFLDLPLNWPDSNETANDASPARKPRESLPHLPPTLEVLAHPGPLPAPLPFQASSNKERNGNVRIVARWAISRQTKSVPPDFFLTIWLLFLPLLPLRGRGKLLPFLQPPGRGRRVLLMHSLPILTMISFFDSPKNVDEISIARLESFPKWTAALLHVLPLLLLLAALFPFQNSSFIHLSTQPFSSKPKLTDFSPPLYRLCPLLNGTIRQEDGFKNAAFMGAPPTMP